MPISEAQRRSVRKYNEKAYDRIELKVTKGKKAILQAHAADLGESLNKFVNRAIDETVERDQQGAAEPTSVSEEPPWHLQR
jgi:predicted HicB family RNase H-like nuclease